MSLNLLNFNNINLLTPCNNQEPWVDEVTMDTLKDSGSVGSALLVLVSSRINQWAMIGANDNVIIHNDVNSLSPAAPDPLTYSNDFGATWNAVGVPADAVWNAVDPVNYPTYQGDYKVWGIKVVPSGRIYVNFASEVAVISSVCYSDDDGASWTLFNSGATVAVTPIISESYGKGRSLWQGQYTISLSSSGNQLLMGGTSYKGNVTFQLGGWNDALGLGTGLNGDLTVAYWSSSGPSLGGGGSGFEQLGGDAGVVYQNGGNTSFIYATPQRVGMWRTATVFWTGSAWNTTQTGTFETSAGGDNINGFTITGLTAELNGWQADGTTLMIPLVDKDDDTHANYAQYYDVQGTTVATPIDYSSLIVKGDPVNEGQTFFFNIYYVRNAARWVMVYGFIISADKPTYCYMRVAGVSPGVADFGPALKVNLPSGFEFNLGPNAGGPFAIDYSRRNKSWVIAVPVETSAPLYHHLVCSFLNVFDCP